MIVIDEVHNIRIIFDEEGKNMKKTSNNFSKFFSTMSKQEFVITL